jgi:hypothetical protein
MRSCIEGGVNWVVGFKNLIHSKQLGRLHEMVETVKHGIRSRLPWSRDPPILAFPRGLTPTLLAGLRAASLAVLEQMSTVVPKRG